MSNLEQYGAKRIKKDDLPDHMGELDPEAATVVHCRSGGSSSQAVELLQSVGFEKIWNLDGGLKAWATDVDPSMDVA